MRSAIGMVDGEFTELPASASGYVVALTDRRVMIFSADGKSLLTASPLDDLWLQPVDHGDAMFTLVFMTGEDRVAVTTRRESAPLTRHFIESFPDRRDQPRVLHVVGPPTIADF